MGSACPGCGTANELPSGTYELVSLTREAVSDWDEQRQQRLVAAIEEAREARNPRDAVTQALEREPTLWSRVKHLLIPSTPTEFWGLITTLAATVGTAATLTMSGGGVTYNEHAQTIINRPTYIEQDRGASNRPSPSPKRHKPKGNHGGKRKR